MIAVLHRCTSAFFLLGIAPEKMAEAIANDGKTPFQINIPIDGFGISRGAPAGPSLCAHCRQADSCVHTRAVAALCAVRAIARASGLAVLDCARKQSPVLRVLCVLCGAKLECSGGGW